MVKKVKKAPKSQTQPVTATDLKANLSMTGREYMATAKGQKELMDRWQPMFDAQDKRFKEIAEKINKSFINLGALNSISIIRERYSNILKSFPKDLFVKPEPINNFYPSGAFLRPTRQSLTEDDIDLIARKAAEKIEPRFKELEGVIHNKQQTTIFLTKDGDLYREPKEQYIYRMRDQGKRLSILRYLDTSFKSTEDICQDCGIKNNVTTRQTVGTINDKAKNLLDLSEKLIDGKTGSGYRINPIYKLIKL